MQKWKRDCHLIKTNTEWKREEGITLIELLASLAILSVVIILVGSVHIFGQRQFINQTESASQANDLTYSLSVMSRDLRKVDSALVEVNETNDVIYIENVPTYGLNGTSLMKNNSEVLSERVGSVDFAMIYEGVEKIGLTVTLFSTGNQQNQSKKYQTTIYFRR